MNTKAVPFPTPEDLAAESLAAAVESAIGGLQERLANLAGDAPDSKWSVSDLIRLLQLRDELRGQRPRTIIARWVDDPQDIANSDIGNNDIGNSDIGNNDIGNNNIGNNYSINGARK